MPSPGGKVDRPERSEGKAGRKGNAGGNLLLKDLLKTYCKVEPQNKPIAFQNDNIIARIPLPPLRGTFPPGEGIAQPALGAEQCV